MSAAQLRKLRVFNLGFLGHILATGDSVTETIYDKNKNDRKTAVSQTRKRGSIYPNYLIYGMMSVSTLQFLAFRVFF